MDNIMVIFVQAEVKRINSLIAWLLRDPFCALVCTGLQACQTPDDGFTLTLSV